MLALQIQTREVTKLLNQYDHAAIIKAIGADEVIQLVIDEMGGLNQFINHIINEYPVDLAIQGYIDNTFVMQPSDYHRRG